MKKLMSLLLTASCLASAPVFAFETTLVGNDEYMAPLTAPSVSEAVTGDQDTLARTYCPRGWDRVPQYRWNWRRHRWEIVGWTCRRHRTDYPDNPRHPRRPGDNPNPGGPGDGVWPPSTWSVSR